MNVDDVERTITFLNYKKINPIFHFFHDNFYFSSKGVSNTVVIVKKVVANIVDVEVDLGFRGNCPNAQANKID